jgi:hypothetical protein
LPLPLATVPVGICFKTCFSMYSGLAVKHVWIRKVALLPTPGCWHA